MQSKTTTATKSYPDRPITVIVPFSAGGGLELVARSMEKLAPSAGMNWSTPGRMVIRLG